MAGRIANKLAFGAILVVLIGGFAVVRWRRAGQRASVATSGSRTRRASATVRPDAAVPAAVAKRSAGPPRTYVGSARCSACHEQEYAAWKRSWHAKALAPATPPFVVGNFANAHFAGTSSEAWMKRRGPDYVMRTRGVDGKQADFAVQWLIGGKRMQDAVTVFPDGRWQVLPVYFHVADGQWVDYTEAKQGALSPTHPFYWTNSRRMANHECLDCHTTGLRVAYDESARTWSTEWVDPNVACEDCHGAGSAHAASTEAADIVQPVTAGEVGMSACARCHGPRRPLFPLLDPAHQFELGQAYDELYDPIVVTMDGGMSPDFFVDGRPKTSSYEYQAMLQAACFRQGKATCLTCHAAPHAPGEGRHAELRDRDPDASCKGCHADVAAAGSAHTHHQTAPAQRCIACHMPPVVSGVLDHFADHSIDVPVPQNTEAHGVPSACGVCHADRPAAALSASLAAWWPNAGVRAARRIRLAAAFDPATARASARPLLQVLTDTAEAPTLRGAAAILLARRFGPQTAPALRPMLSDPNVLLRAKGAEAIGIAKAVAAADALAAHIEDPSLRVQLAVALALADLADPRGEDALRRLAEAPESSHLLAPHTELGPRYAQQGKLQAARHELRQVAALAPYYADALVQLARVEAALGDLTAARARLAQSLQLEPQHAGAKALRTQLDRKPAPAAAAVH